MPLARELPQLARIMGHEYPARSGPKMFNIVAPASPGEEGTSVEAAFKAIHEMKNKGTGAAVRRQAQA